jgi:uncharacterized membrane protein
MTEPVTPEKRDPEQGKTLALYALFIIALILQVMPFLAVQIFSLLLLGLTIVVITILKSGSIKDGLLHNHATYLARSFWIWSFLMSTGGLVASYLIYQQHSQQEWINIAHDLLENETDSVHYKVMARYFIASLAPGMIYLTYRLVRGLRRALHGYRLAKPKSWF